MIKPWLYFGCGPDGDKSHGLFLSLEDKGSSLPPVLRQFKKFDTLLAPQGETEPLYIAALSSLEGWGYSALSWWDRTVDTRPGSNSIIFCPTTKVSAEMIIHSANQPHRFAYVFERLPQELTLWIPKW